MSKKVCTKCGNPLSFSERYMGYNICDKCNNEKKEQINHDKHYCTVCGEKLESHKLRNGAATFVLTGIVPAIIVGGLATKRYCNNPKCIRYKLAIQ